MTVRQDLAISFCLSATLAIGLMLAATDGAPAGTVKRDHRGEKAKKMQAPGIGGSKWKGGYEQLGAPGVKGAPSGVTVRDHR